MWQRACRDVILNMQMTGVTVKETWKKLWLGLLKSRRRGLKLRRGGGEVVAGMDDDSSDEGY
jgi:hypothetical protein